MNESPNCREKDTYADAPLQQLFDLPLEPIQEPFHSILGFSLQLMIRPNH